MDLSSRGFPERGFSFLLPIVPPPLKSRLASARRGNGAQGSDGRQEVRRRLFLWISLREDLLKGRFLLPPANGPSPLNKPSAVREGKPLRWDVTSARV